MLKSERFYVSELAMRKIEELSDRGYCCYMDLIYDYDVFEDFPCTCFLVCWEE